MEEKGGKALKRKRHGSFPGFSFPRCAKWQELFVCVHVATVGGPSSFGALTLGAPGSTEPGGADSTRNVRDEESSGANIRNETFLLDLGRQLATFFSSVSTVPAEFSKSVQTVAYVHLSCRVLTCFDKPNDVTSRVTHPQVPPEAAADDFSARALGSGDGLDMSGWNSSYVFGNDQASGWGPRYFYTFYSEFGRRRGAAEAEVVALSLTFLLSVTLNVTIGCAVLRYREMRTVTNCFLLNLAAADLVFALGIPVVAVTRVTREWILGDLACRLLPYSQFVCGFVLLWTLTLISIDRHRCIVVPPYRSRLTPVLAAALTLGTWLLALVLFLPVAFWFREEKVDHGTVICTLVFPRSDKINSSLCFTIPVVLLTCLLPMSLLVFHYQRIFRKLTKTRNRWSSNAHVTVSSIPDLDSSPTRRQSSLSVIGGFASPWSRKTSGGSQTALGPAIRPRGSLSQHEELRLAKHVRVVRVLLLNVVAVLLMWLPITILMFLIYVDGSRPNEDTGFFLRSHHFIWSLLVALLNTVVNPLLYGVLSENFRSCFARMWLSSRRKKKCNAFFEEQGKTNHSRSNNDTARENENPSSGRWNDAYSASQVKANISTHPM